MPCVSVFLIAALLLFISRVDALQGFVALDDAEKIRTAVAADSSELNKVGGGGQTPIMAACLGGKVNAVKALLDLGADVSIGEQDGYTPMHGAGFQGRAEVAKLLISHGLSMTDRHEDGYTPFHRACWGMESRHTDTVRVFLDAGIDIDIKGADGKTCRRMTKNEKTRKLLVEWKKSQTTGTDGSADL
mmetsp:Transcript_3276/g.5094  ORF Transcript_3276/g.5094 Transcript_3276/m.5094 type:complete len:188 (+) Transcript_3276:77-640(+)